MTVVSGSSKYSSGQVAMRKGLPWPDVQSTEAVTPLDNHVPAQRWCSMQALCWQLPRALTVW